MGFLLISTSCNNQYYTHSALHQPSVRLQQVMYTMKYNDILVMVQNLFIYILSFEVSFVIFVSSGVWHMVTIQWLVK